MPPPQLPAAAEPACRSTARVAASDAFIPFRDGLDAVAAAGAAAIVQPGGSLRDAGVSSPPRTRTASRWCSPDSRHFRLSRGRPFGPHRLLRPRDASARVSALTSRRTARSSASPRASGERQRDEDQEQHQELGVAEVVLEHTRPRASSDDRRETRWRPAALDRSRASLREARQISARDEPAARSAERRQAAFGGDLQRDVVQVRVDRALTASGTAILRRRAAAPCSGRCRRADASCIMRHAYRAA